MKKVLLFMTFCFLSLCSFGQIVDTLEVEKDAMIRELSGIGDNTNYGNYPYTNMHAGTNQGNLVVHRSLLKFDLTQIPIGATILFAELVLKTDENSPLYVDGHLNNGQSNLCRVRRIIEEWEENGVVWNNQPNTTTVNTVTLDPSTSNFQNYNVDVTALVKDMIAEPNLGFGFRIALNNEVPYTRMVFASSDNANPLIHPKLMVLYELPIKTIDHQNDAVQFSVFPNPASDHFIVQLSNSNVEHFDIDVYDETGKLVFSRKNIDGNEVQLDVKPFDTGLYFYRIITDQHETGVGKIMIN